MKYVLNQRYLLRNEGNKVLLLMRPDAMSVTSIHVIHPTYAMILSCVNGCSIEEAAAKAVIQTGIPINKILSILNSLIKNESPVRGYKTVFPVRTIVKYCESDSIQFYPENAFICQDLDLRLSRLKIPADIICNLTMNCYTSCTYCYADRFHHFEMMPLKRVCEIIDEAKKLDVISFKLMGGDIFLYPNWKIVMSRLVELGYSPSVSTKYPLRESDVRFLRDATLDSSPLQLSIDTLIPEHVKNILHISPEKYIADITKTLLWLEKYEIPYMINTVICSANGIYKKYNI